MRRLAGLSSRQRMLLGGVALGGIVALVVVILLVASIASSAEEEQPIAFTHRVHVVDNGIQCQFCHVGVDQSPVASIPSVEKCMGCHGHIATTSPEIQKLAGYWERQEPIPWVRVNRQPSSASIAIDLDLLGNPVGYDSIGILKGYGCLNFHVATKPRGVKNDP